MKRLRMIMVKILKSNLGIVRHLVMFIADCIFRKINMTGSIKTAALMLLDIIRNMWTKACKSLASLTLNLLKLGGQCLIFDVQLHSIHTITLFD
jgi:hypothetical protein